MRTAQIFLIKLGASDSEPQPLEDSIPFLTYEDLQESITQLCKDRSFVRRGLRTFGGGLVLSSVHLPSDDPVKLVLQIETEPGLSSWGDALVEDLSLQHVRDLLTPYCGPLPTSAAALRAFLADTASVKLTVTPSVYNLAVAQSVPKADLSPGNSLLATAFGQLVNMVFCQYGSELGTSMGMITIIQTVFMELGRCDREGLQIEMQLNTTDNISTAKATVSRCRPDFSAYVRDALVFLGEDKRPRGLQAAEADIKKKVTGLDIGHYGAVQSILAYAAAGDIVRLYRVGAGGEVEQITRDFSMSGVQNRVELIKCMVRVYQVLMMMGKQLPAGADRMPLFKPLERPHGYVIPVVGGFKKSIKDARDFFGAHFTSFDVIARAYAVAANAAIALQKPFLVTSTSGPSMTRHAYGVFTVPAGYRRIVDSVEELKGVAFACCHAARALHAAGIVHRDFRAENVVRLAGEAPAWMVIDLELAADADVVLPDSYALADWDSDTLELGCYTRMSDMHQIGLMLSKLGERMDLPCEAGAFFTILIRKELSAEDAVAHAWLSA